MKFTADDYRFAALERIRAAQSLFKEEFYVEAIYVAGVATECILRAYRMRMEPEFDSRHDLPDLLRVSGLDDFVPEKRRREISAALGDMWARWRNDYRYAATDKLLKAFKQTGLCIGIRGDQLKANARIALESSLQIVSMGDARWNRTFSRS